MDRMIYADNASTTKLSGHVLSSMMPYLTEEYGNPSSLYAHGGRAKAAIELAREQVAKAVGAIPAEIFFTASGTESDNWALKGAAGSMRKKGKTHIISSAFEHHAVLHTLGALRKQGFTVTLLPVHSDGLVRLDEFKNAITENTGLVTIMYANNEIGTVQPISEIGTICKEKGIWFHTDAVQAVGNIPIDVKAQNIDMLSMSAHKLHGPKGAGALYVRKGVVIDRFVDGGAQERGRRAGTENTAGIVGLGTAVTDAVKDMDSRNKKLCAMRDRLIEGALKIERSRLNGDPDRRLAGNANLCFEGIEGESLLLLMDLEGVCASSGSACTSGSLDPSHVLLSIGLPHEIAHGSLRLSFSDENTMDDVDHILSVLPGIVDKLRFMSPLWERIKSDEAMGKETYYNIKAD